MSPVRENSRQDYRHGLYMKDDFACGIQGNGTGGELGWTQGGSIASIVVQGHPGVYHIDTTATITTLTYMCLSLNGGTTQPLHVDDIWETVWVVRQNTADTDTQIRIGVAASASGNPASNGVYFEQLYADTSWYGVTRFGGTQTKSSAILGYDTGWHTFRVRRINSTTIGFTIDNGTEVTQNSNVPTGLGVQPFIHIINQTAASKTVDIDLFECLVSGLSRT